MPILLFIGLMSLGYWWYECQPQATGIELVLVPCAILSLAVAAQTEVSAKRLMLPPIACLALSAWVFTEGHRLSTKAGSGSWQGMFVSSVAFVIAAYVWISLSFRIRADLGASWLLGFSVAILLAGNFGWHLTHTTELAGVSQSSRALEAMRSSSFILYTYLCARWFLWKLTVSLEPSVEP